MGTVCPVLRALLPGGPIEEHGRDAVVARFSRWFAGMDTVDLVESAGQAVADRLLIHYRLDLAQRGTRWACTQTSICKRAACRGRGGFGERRAVPDRAARSQAWPPRARI